MLIYASLEDRLPNEILWKKKMNQFYIVFNCDH